MTRSLDPAPVIAFCVAFALVLFLPPVLNDGDTLWQIRAGEWILDHHSIPAIDPFSFSAGDRPWHAHEWLAETLMALAWRAAGMAGVMGLAAAATGLSAAVMLHYLRRFLPGIYSVLALVIAFANAAPSLLARPHLLAWPCLVLWCGGLVAARSRRTAPSFALLPVMVLWVNLHGSFMIGPVLCLAFLVEAQFDRCCDHRKALTDWATFTLATCVVTLINPDGPSGALFPVHMLGMGGLGFIGEWQPPDFSRLQLLELMILGALALGLSGKVRLPPVRLVLLLGLIHGALTHARNEQLLGLAGTLILAEPLGASLGRGHAATLGHALRYAAGGAAFFAILAMALRLTLPLTPERTGAAFASVIDQIPPSLRAQPVLNEYGLGGDLIFQGIRPFIDSRADLYGDAFLSQYSRIVAADQSALDQILSQYGIRWTIFPFGHPILVLLDREPGWRRLVNMDGVVIHVRADSGK